jgi:hypothetical protein
LAQNTEKNQPFSHAASPVTEANHEKSAARNKRPDCGASNSVSTASGAANRSTMLALAHWLHFSMRGGTWSGWTRSATTAGMVDSGSTIFVFVLSGKFRLSMTMFESASTDEPLDAKTGASALRTGTRRPYQQSPQHPLQSPSHN